MDGRNRATSQEALRRSQQEIINRLALVVESHDSTTGSHIERMGAIAATVGAELGLDAEQVELLRLAAPMHDVGKTAIPDTILNKPARSPTRSASRCSATPRSATGSSRGRAAPARPRGDDRADPPRALGRRGVPAGLRGNEIPVEGRIAAVADVFDALTSDRPYRPALSEDEALAMVRAGSGTHFDPAVVAAFVTSLETSPAARELRFGPVPRTARGTTSPPAATPS